MKRAKVTASSAVVAPEPAAAPAVEAAPVETRILTTAVYVTGSTALEPGRRYIIAVHGSRLRILGPVDVDPSAVALDNALAGLDATSSDGRLVVSGSRGRSAMFVVFMSVAGTTTEQVATAIVDAVAAETRALA